MAEKTDEVEGKPEEASSLTKADVDKILQERLEALQAEAKAKADAEAEAKEKEMAEKNKEIEELRALQAQQVQELKLLKDALSAKVDLPKNEEPPSPQDVLAAELESTKRALAEQDTALAEKLAAIQKSLEEQQKSLETQAAKAEKALKTSELKAYKEKRVAEEGVTLVNMVTGDSQEEIDASIKEAQKLEAELLSKHQTELAGNLPQALKPGQMRTAPQNVRTFKQMRDLVSNPAEFSKWKKQQLEDLKESGINLR